MSKDENDETLTFRLPSKLRRDLEQQADDEGVKLSERVRAILQGAVDQDVPVGSSTRVVLDEIQALRSDLRLRRRRKRRK